ncbi:MULTISPECIES: S-layer homology domain-containing protein [unclassified Candidatus Frackibacter]|uniref:S-layer homology domain-containing protein n=1 Tax=unclassified Candidatus Frackibacter TaxID=2648818 RepID=UPI000798F51C|nr:MULTISPECIES: S-layer homology domain-containing protein [unclassified Candidatus Frackibacter]KXS45911.1 MAG: S-layer protein [Candidatus Frackibacter sp. T328-2]SDC08962.1 S-layer homology domain-containing protein [Candidatus Frackibacter sp. WG11]SEM38025.1 S-layer homology domain-containing protein [Candidatus Frackibacter sp. WG12]SFL43530.1 S-layer homology domain-containing protein [Candidatus Frackibacter sp. WG13]
MKKKLSIVLAIVMLFALTAPVMANPFKDVPANHWAYDAIKKASEMGIVTGYEDGTFKGDKKLTRYEMAVATARIASQIEDEDVQAKLTAKQVAEVEKTVKALNSEFNKELSALEKRVNALEAKGLNVKIDGEATTIFTETNVEGNPDFGTANIEDGQYWDDWDDTLDDDAPAQKEFRQEFDFNINTIVDEDTTVSLILDTIADDFTNPVAWDGSTPGEDAPQFKLDDALLAIEDGNYGLKVGDFEDYHVTNYFYDDEDVEGVEVNANVLGTDFLVFRGKDDDTAGNDIKAIKASRNIAGIDLAGQYLKANDEGVYGVTAKTDLVPGVSSQVKYLAKDNSQDKNYLVDGEASTKFAGINLTAGYKEVGVNFDGYNDFKGDDDIYDAGEDYEPGIKGYRVAGDMDVLPGLNVFANVEDEELATNNDNIITTEAGAKYALTNNTDVSASYEAVDSDNGNDVDTINTGLEGNYFGGKLATVVDYELEDEKAGEETNTLDIRNKIAVSDTVKLTADAQYETKEAATTDTERIYYAVGADHKLTENTSFGVNYRVVDFNDNATSANDYKAESINGEFKVSF